MSDNIIEMHKKPEDGSADHVLLSAKGKFDDVVILGYSGDELHISYSAGLGLADIVYMLEAIKVLLLTPDSE